MKTRMQIDKKAKEKGKQQKSEQQKDEKQKLPPKKKKKRIKKLIYTNVFVAHSNQPGTDEQHPDKP